MTEKSEITKIVVSFPGAEFKPTRLASGLIGLRAPLAVQVANGKSATIDLQMVCSVPLLVVSEFQTEPSFIMPQGKIVISLMNDHGAPLRFEAGEVIARAYPLFPIDYEIEYQKTAKNAGEDCGCC